MSKDELIAASALVQLISPFTTILVHQDAISATRSRGPIALAPTVQFAPQQHKYDHFASTSAIDRSQRNRYSRQDHNTFTFSHSSLLLSPPQDRFLCNSLEIDNRTRRLSAKHRDDSETTSTSARGTSLGSNRSTNKQEVSYSLKTKGMRSSSLGKGNPCSIARKRTGVTANSPARKRQKKAEENRHDCSMLLTEGRPNVIYSRCGSPPVKGLAKNDSLMKLQDNERHRHAREVLMIHPKTFDATAPRFSPHQSPIVHANQFPTRTTNADYYYHHEIKKNIPRLIDNSCATHKYAIFSSFLPCIPVGIERESTLLMSNAAFGHRLKTKNETLKKEDEAPTTVAEFLRSLATKNSRGTSFQHR